MRRTRILLLLALLTTAASLASAAHAVDPPTVRPSPGLGGYEVICKAKAYKPRKFDQYVIARTEVACWLRFDNTPGYLPAPMPKISITNCLLHYLGDEVFLLRKKCESDVARAGATRFDLFVEMKCSLNSPKGVGTYFKNDSIVSVQYPSGRNDTRTPKSNTRIVWGCVA